MGTWYSVGFRMRFRFGGFLFILFTFSVYEETFSPRIMSSEHCRNCDVVPASE
jgi:hypothetical protein